MGHQWINSLPWSCTTGKQRTLFLISSLCPTRVGDIQVGTGESRDTIMSRLIQMGHQPALVALHRYHDRASFFPLVTQTCTAENLARIFPDH